MTCGTFPPGNSWEFDWSKVEGVMGAGGGAIALGGAATCPDAGAGCTFCVIAGCIEGDGAVGTACGEGGAAGVCAGFEYIPIATSHGSCPPNGSPPAPGFAGVLAAVGA